jgi:tetratricopeptide (TPR) repeat protein
MVLLARMTFNINDESTYQQAYEYLSTAEQLCAELKISSGYRWLSGSYHHFGITMIKTELYAGAIYPLRKSCTLLEKDTERINTDEGKLQACKRYEILGTCCQKNERFEEAIKAYRVALKRVPASTILKFVNQADTIAVSTIIEKDPLVSKLIDRFLRASIIDPYQSKIHFACEFMDLSSLNQIQQCFIYECELKVWNVLALKMNLSKYQLHIVDKLLEVYNSTEYPIRRTRYNE